MKIALIITLSLALVLAVARAQFKPAPVAPATQPPSALPVPSVSDAAPAVGAASNDPLALPESPVPGTTRNKPVTVPPGERLPQSTPSADAFGVGAGYSPNGPSQNAGYPSLGTSQNNANFTHNGRPQNGNQFYASNRAPLSAPQTAAQMLRESELKVMRQHYEKVWQEILEAEEKVQLATTDGAGNSKGDSDANTATQQDRLQVLRRYADRLQAEITTRAEAQEERAIPGMGMMPANPATTPPAQPGASSDDAAFARSFPTAYANSLLATGKFALLIPMLTAHVDAQHAALASEQVSLNEAQDQLNRTEAAYAQHAVSMEELSHAKFAVKKAEASVQKAEAELRASSAELAFANRVEGVVGAGGSPSPGNAPATPAVPALTSPSPVPPVPTPVAPAPAAPAPGTTAR